MITEQQNSGSQTRDHDWRGFRRERPSTRPRRRPAAKAQRLKRTPPKERKGTPAPNKANWPMRTEMARAGNGTGGIVARAHCAKQTQFGPPRLERALPTVGAFAPNKANWPTQPGMARAGEGPSETVARACCAKQTQFAPPRPGKALPTLGAFAPNKANWQRSFRWEVSSEQSPAAGPPNLPLPTSYFTLPTCETKPILPERRSSTVWKRSYDELDAQQTSTKQSQFPHGQQWARTGKAACAADRTNRAKQTQFDPQRPEKAPPTVRAIAPNKANCSQASTRERGPARSPVSAPPDQSVRNKAKCSRTREGRRGVFSLPASQQMDIIRPRMTTQRRPGPPQDRESIRLEVWP
jgi:hypothetical protein